MILASILSNLGTHFWEPFWDHIGPRGAEMGPGGGPSRASKNRKPAFAKTLKNHLCFKVFGIPRPSKTAYEDPRRLPRGYLGLLGAILSHLGTILETRAFQKAPAGFNCCWGSPRLPILGSILGPKIVLKSIFLGVIVWTSFWQFFVNFWGHFGDRFQEKMESTSWPIFWKALGGSLEPFWEVSWLCWGSLGRPGVPKHCEKQ